jgi:hypothetical protein
MFILGVDFRTRKLDLQFSQKNQDGRHSFYKKSTNLIFFALFRVMTHFQCLPCLQMNRLYLIFFIYKYIQTFSTISTYLHPNKIFSPFSNSIQLKSNTVSVQFGLSISVCVENFLVSSEFFFINFYSKCFFLWRFWVCHTIAIWKVFSHFASRYRV